MATVALSEMMRDALLDIQDMLAERGQHLDQQQVTLLSLWLARLQLRGYSPDDAMQHARDVATGDIGELDDLLNSIMQGK